jgi:hypothetical protein
MTDPATQQRFLYFENRSWELTGEIRPPRSGEVYVCENGPVGDGQILRAVYDHDNPKDTPQPILRPVPEDS